MNGRKIGGTIGALSAGSIATADLLSNEFNIAGSGFGFVSYIILALLLTKAGTELGGHLTGQPAPEEPAPSPDQ